MVRGGEWQAVIVVIALVAVTYYLYITYIAPVTAAKYVPTPAPTPAEIQVSEQQTQVAADALHAAGCTHLVLHAGHTLDEETVSCYAGAT
jgi:hypothetical protein